MLHQADHDKTEGNPDAFPLLHLPAELRNEIYAYAFDSIRIEVEALTSAGRHGAPEIQSCAQHTYEEGLSLLLVCRQIKKETVSFRQTFRRLKVSGPVSRAGLNKSVRNRVETITFSGNTRSSRILKAVLPSEPARVVWNSWGAPVFGVERGPTLMFPSLKTIYLDGAILGLPLDAILESLRRENQDNAHNAFANVHGG